MPWARILSLLSSSSLAALMIGGSGNAAHANVCGLAGPTGFDNPASTTILCIDAVGLHLVGDITNEGTINRGIPHVPIISVFTTQMTGNIVNSGVTDNFISLTHGTTVTGNI